MPTPDQQATRDYLRAEFWKADEVVQRTLNTDPAQFQSSAQMRDALNRARGTRQWVTDRLEERGWRLAA